MKSTRNFIKSLTIITIGIVIMYFIKENSFLRIGDIIQNNLSQVLRTVKITEENSKVNYKNITLNIKMPEVHYENKDVERYINTYIRKNVNEFVNEQKQISEITNRKSKTSVSVGYDIAFENKKLLNIVIYRDIKLEKDKFKLEKDSYIFDLNTGQRIYLDNFLKENDDYNQVIENYINNYIDEKKIKLDKDKIVVDKYTNYILSDGGIDVYFNPYKDSENKVDYEFKVPYEVFNNIKMIETSEIVANVDTQTITNNNKYINSVINIPIIMTQNKDIERSINDRIKNDIMQDYNKSQEEAKAYIKDYPEGEVKFVANTDFEVKKNSDNMLSILVKYYKYSGGAHGYYENIAYNIDMRDGNILKLSDLFKTQVNYKEVINKEIRNQIEDLGKTDKENVGIYQFNSIKDDQKFYIQDDNLVIYFDLYDIAPYAAGIPEFLLNINSISHILKYEYIEFFK
ncbi:DUF3298/DUF4163 domain-containing protein [Romboutsia weinsteinii]|uniref:DUF3298/DUF4163 domain-containing protein n=1 Tax=Romboutsia weinsteinii TaxID=2020949 RepID=A0A371IZT1_9FIRM|nr:DUF3298 and DUF4163 domain-containing protein [Romboutsia weinsteinii]RDY26072.1 DUF3298/DUF4163 domain-containing protein [Romboutsia weinsteinii]